MEGKNRGWPGDRNISEEKQLNHRSLCQVIPLYILILTIHVSKSWTLCSNSTHNFLFITFSLYRNALSTPAVGMALPKMCNPNLQPLFLPRESQICSG